MNISSLGADISFSPDVTGAKKTVFVLGGRKPDASWLADFTSRGRADVWAVDSGITACREAGICPRVIIGDMDSVPPDDHEWARSSGASEFIYPREKDATDFQLAINALREQKNGSRLIISGCFGGRLDHLFSVLNTFADSGALCMIDDRECVCIVRPYLTVSVNFHERPAAISLLPLSEYCHGVKIRGVRWPLADESLDRKFPWTVSNELLEGKNEITASCASGIVGLYWVNADLLLKE
jgi:thiamine pyrophosphokinase